MQISEYIIGLMFPTRTHTGSREIISSFKAESDFKALKMRVPGARIWRKLHCNKFPMTTAMDDTGQQPEARRWAESVCRDCLMKK